MIAYQLIHWIADTTGGHYVAAGAIVLICIKKGLQKL